MNIMNRLIKNALIVVLFLVVVVGCRTNVCAADPRMQSQPPTKGTVAKVLIVDRAAKAITVDIRGTIHLLWLSADVKVRKDGTDATIADIAPGQMVSFTTKKTARGDVEIVVEITLESSDTETEAAGRVRAAKLKDHMVKGDGREKEKKERFGDQGRATPLIFAPAPVTRPVVSPHN